MGLMEQEEVVKGKGLEGAYLRCELPLKTPGRNKTREQSLPKFAFLHPGFVAE